MTEAAAAIQSSAVGGLVLQEFRAQLGAGGIGSWVLRAESAVETCGDGQVLSDLYVKAKLAKKLLEELKAARELVAHATRLQLACLRRIGQLELDKEMPRGVGSRCRYLASLPDHEFEEFKKSVTGEYAGTTEAMSHERRAFYRRASLRMQKQQERQLQRFLGGHVDERRYWTRDDGQRELKLAEAAQELVGNLCTTGAAFTTDEARQELAEALGIEYMPDNPLVREGLTEALRLAVQNANGSSLDHLGSEEMECPEIVIFWDENLEAYVKLHWSYASIRQLEKMVVHRERQAAQMASVAATLRHALELFIAVREKRKCTEILGDIYRATKGLRKGWYRPDASSSN
jgi:hypothetical protein